MQTSWVLFKNGINGDHEWARVSECDAGDNLILSFDDAGKKLECKLLKGTVEELDYTNNFSTKKKILTSLSGIPYRQSIGKQPPPGGITRTIVTPDWGDQTTWYQNSNPISVECTTQDGVEFDVPCQTLLVDIDSFKLSTPRTSMITKAGGFVSRSTWRWKILINDIPISDSDLSGYIDYRNKKIGVFDHEGGTKINSLVDVQAGDNHFVIDGEQSWIPGQFISFMFKGFNYTVKRVFKISEVSYDSVENKTTVVLHRSFDLPFCNFCPTGDEARIDPVNIIEPADTVVFEGYEVNPVKSSLFVVRPSTGRKLILNLAEINCNSDIRVTDVLRMSVFGGDPGYNYYFGTPYEAYCFRFRSVIDYVNMGNYGNTFLAQFANQTNIMEKPWEYYKTGIIEINSSTFSAATFVLEKGIGFQNCRFATLQLHVEDVPEN